MDKGKNRTDLLAAGRKKLQQYRQKKETKGSSTHGKSLKKSDKEEFDMDVDTTSVAGKLSSEFQPDGGELPASVDSDIKIKSESHFSENSNAPEIEVEHTGKLAIPATHGSRTIDRTEVQSTELPHRELSSSQYFDSSVVNTEVDASVGVASDIIVSEVASESFDDSVSVDISTKPASVVVGVGFEVQVEGRDGNGEASSSSQESILPSLPIQGRDNQEASGFVSKESDGGGAVDLERGGNLPFCELGGGTEIPLSTYTMVTNIKERSCDAERSCNSGEASALLADGGITSGFVGVIANHSEEVSTLTRMEGNPQDTQPESVGDDGKEIVERLPEKEICDEGSFAPPISNVCSISVLQLRELIRTLSDEEFSIILESMESDSKNRPMIGSLSDNSCYHRVEKLKEELILSNLTNNICQLVTSDQSTVEMDLNCLRYDNVSLKEACQKNQIIIEELAQCRLELQNALGGRDECEKELTAANAEIKDISARAFQLEISLGRSQDDMSKLVIELDNFKCEKESLNGTVASLTEDIHKLKHEKEFLLLENEKISTANTGLESSVTAIELENSKLVAEKKKLEEEVAYLSQENKKLSKEVVDCNSLAATLRLEIADLQRNLTLLTVEKTKIGEDKEYLSNEKESILSELVVLRKALSVENAKYTILENTLNEVKACQEQLTEDNIFLYQKLDVYETTLREIDYKKSLILSEAAEDENQADNRWRKGVGGGTQIEILEQGTHYNSLELATLKQNSEKANNILQKLEKAHEGLQLQSLSLTKSNNKSAAPSISKLIQAFELKASIDEHEVMERAVNESQLLVDPFTLMKELTVNLRKVLLLIEMTAENASMAFMNERHGHESAKGLYGKLKEQYDALEGHCQGMMTNIIELGVLYDATKVHMADAGARIMELELAVDISSQEKCSLQVAVRELTTKLCTYETKVSELTDQISYVQQSSNEMASLVSTELDNLKKEAAERASTLENDWNSLAAQTQETTRKLDESVAKCISLTDITINYERLDNSTISERVAASVNVAVTVIEDLKQKLDNAHIEHKTINSLCEEVNEKYDILHGMNELALALLNKVYCDLQNILSGSVSRSDLNVQIEKLPHPLDYVYFDTIMKQLEDFLSERLELESVNSNLNSKLMNKSKELEDISRRCLDSVSMKKLIEDIHVALKLEDTDDNLDEAPASHLMSLILLLVQKYGETNAQIDLFRLEFDSKMMEFTEMQERMDELNTLTLQQENEILLLRETSNQMEEALTSAHAELKEKIGELEQSEQRVTSIREKLSIAVAKGKGLVVQRDSLKHSLAETSSELEKCMEELKLKEIRLHEVDIKLKSYSEAGERVEALESELSYIRNSATALRESFLLKDSVLQRIEEILEDLELPEHFHAKDIIEKVDWLARSTLVNSGPQTDYDQKTYPAEGTYSDDSFAVMDDRKDGLPTGTISDEHLRLKYEELQCKFYGLAEQNEMLEQSLMLRNSLVQRWEELLDMINIPSHLQSLEPEDRIEWLGKELSVAQSDRSFLQQKVDYFENLCGSLTTDLNELRKNFSGLEADFEALNSDRESLFRRYETLFSDNERLLLKAVENDVENVILHYEVNQLQENLCNFDRDIQILQDLVSDVLQGFEIKDLVSASSIDCLGEMVRKLIDVYMVKSVLESSSPKENIEETAVVLDAPRSIDTLDSSKFDADVQKKELDDALLELTCAREERDKYIGMYQYTVSEVESLDKKLIELQELLNQEEQKSASVREKLNVAVRKGKSLVQQRDSLKQTIEGMANELDCLKSEIKRHENAVAIYELKIKDLSSDSEMVEALESENLLLRNKMTEKEEILREKEHILSMILETLGDIDVGVSSSDPVVKLKEIGKLCYDLRVSMVSLEQESKKSRRAAELLLTELNEVQERNDAFQDELAQASHELAELTMERDRAEASRYEALSHIEKLSSNHSDEKKSQFSEFVGLISCVDELRKTFHDINHFIVVILSKDLGFWQNVGTTVQSCHNLLNPVDVVGVPLSNASGGFKSWNSDDKGSFLSLDSGMEFNFLGHLDENFVVEEVIGSISHHLKEFKMEIDDLETMLNKHSVIIHEQATSISKLVLAVHGELTSQKDSIDALKRQVSQMELGSKEKDMEVEALHKNIGLLHEACAHLVMEIEQKKAELVGNGWDYKDSGTLKSRTSTLTGQLLTDEHPDFLSEDYIQTMAGRVLSAVREFAGLKADVIGGSQNEMKITIENLQKELQEKDIQKERICSELVGQIKKAEATSTSYLYDLQSSKTRVHDLDKLVEDMKEERVQLEHKIEELEAGFTSTLELEDRVKSLLGVVSSKDQEIEALMQALDEEEIQMEDLTNKIKELEKDLKLKNQELEDLESSRGKVVKKLAVTVSKFDELHHLSGSLLTEVESLQSQLQDRDTEISFLRQEVTRCANDVLVASQTNSAKTSEEICKYLTWFDTMISCDGVYDVHHDDKDSWIMGCKERLQKKTASILTEIEELEMLAQSKDELLQMERNKFTELTKEKEMVEKSLRDKEQRLNMLEAVGETEKEAGGASEISEAEPLIKKWVGPETSMTPQVRGMRKSNTDQVAIAIDMDHSPGSSRLEDEDDDKGHGFKSLTTSKIVPKFTRPVTDMIDGLWVSCDRALMRQPSLRLGIIIYWAVLHALLATFVV